MTASRAVRLGAVARAAAWDGRRVWCASADSIWGFGPGGDRELDHAGPGPLRALAAVPGGPVALTEPATVVWLDGSTGEEIARRPVGGDPSLVGGQDGVFVVDAASERAWPVNAPGALGEPVPVPGLERAAVARGAIWWTSTADDVLRGNGMEVELGASAAGRGAIAGCAGSVWISVDQGLLRVGAWGGETSPPLAAPFGPVARLACGDGRLVGGSREGLFVLDPTVDADARRLDLDFDIGADPGVLVATRESAWVFSATEPVARIVPYR